MRILGSIAALAVTACSSSYTPQSRGRVSVMMQGGGIVYVRDGKIHEHGLFGGGLEDAVRGNRNAEDAADEYTGRLKLGALAVIGGAACSLTATGYALRDIDDSDEADAERALWIALGCSVVMLFGTGYLASAEPYRWDAINLFNDAPPPPVYPGVPPAAGWRPPQQSLKMRD